MCEKGSIFQWNDECEQAFITGSQFVFKISEFIRLGSTE
jgi:hypothetical protein